MTYTIGTGKVLGIVLCLAAFLIMHVLCEEIDESNQTNNSFLDEIERRND